MTAKLPTKTSRIAAVAAAGTLVLAGAGSAYAVHANDVSTHNKQVAAAQFAAEQKAASDKAQADAAAKAAAEKAAEQKAEADAAAKAAADKAAADKAAADKAAADKAAADKAAADKAAADQRSSSVRGRQRAAICGSPAGNPASIPISRTRVGCGIVRSSELAVAGVGVPLVHADRGSPVEPEVHRVAKPRPRTSSTTKAAG